MYRIAYPEDDVFLQSDLVRTAQADPKLRQLHDRVQAVCADARVRLALRHDLAATPTAVTTGAPALPAFVSVGLAVVRRLMGWGYRTVEGEVKVSAGWRWVGGLFGEAMPNFRTIQNREAKLKPKTIRLINAVVVQLGHRLGVTTAQKLRVDSSVTETNIHYPTDSRLLDDAARVLSRLVRQVRQVRPPRTAAEKAWYRDRHRQAHHLARQIGQLAGQQTKNTEKSSAKLYATLLNVVEALLAQVDQLQPRLASVTDPSALALTEAFAHYVPLVKQVVAQTRQRVLKHIAVPASDKIVSLFEPQSAIICRGKPKPKETEFGRKVWYAEVDGGLISEYRLLDGNPPDEPLLLPSLQHHQQLFGKVPREVSGDRKIFSARNEQEARALGVRRVSLPKPGHPSARRRRREHAPWFRAAQRFRNGIEGRLSQLRRARRLERCLNHGPLGMDRWLGWGVIANNLATIALNLIKRHLSPAEALR